MNEPARPMTTQDPFKIAKQHRISVRDLVEICSKQGDLSQGYVSRTRALDGIREHQKLQDSRPEGYQKEVSVSLTCQKNNIRLEVFGRVDGLMESGDGLTVEEIKTCRGPADQRAESPGFLHTAQLKCYGHILVQQQNLDVIILKLTYVRVGTSTTAEHVTTLTAEELKIFFDGLVQTYTHILADQYHWQITRNTAIEEMDFPYPDFRQGQREMAESVYRIIKNEKILFARAPTGTGKTIAALFPAVKSLGLGQIDKIFYLTAKTVGRTVAVKAIRDMRRSGLKLKHVVITAKQKICFISDETCDMDACPFARDYFGKIARAMPDISLFSDFDRERIEALARKYEICPFELSLDVSLICDVIICDLNYCFDPRVYLKRYFDHGSPNAAFLIDEAHNLHERLRSMYSATLLKSDVLSTQRIIRDALPDIARTLVNINKKMLKFRRRCIDEGIAFFDCDAVPEDLLSDIREFSGRADLWLDRNTEESAMRTVLMDFFFQANIFLTISTYFDDNYRFYVEQIGETDLLIRLYCLDPSPIFSDLIHRARSAVMFSATLSPFDYHRSILFNDTVHPFYLDLGSPFPRKNLGLFVHRGIRTAYRVREYYYKDIAELIQQVTGIRDGNYLVYFPSYAFMETIYSILAEDETPRDILMQEHNMSEEERQAFLDTFTPDSSVTGFAVMGGIFGEGIDLTGNRLIGAVIIGPGVPQICPERDLIREYYDGVDRSGFFKSYRMPGFNRVMQAAGRVIRTDTDKGIVILVDERFNHPDYQCLFPPEWHHARSISDTDTLSGEIQNFWEQA